MSVDQKTLHSAMQGAPGEDAREREERQRRASIAYRLSTGETKIEDLDPMDQLIFDPDDPENLIMNPNLGVGSYRSALVSEKQKLPPEEAIPELFAAMKPYRNHLLAILKACREERLTTEVDETLEPEYEFCKCVYSPIALRKLLVEAGALEFVEAPVPTDEESADNEGATEETHEGETEAPSEQAAETVEPGEEQPAIVAAEVEGADNIVADSEGAEEDVDEDIDEVEEAGSAEAAQEADAEPEEDPIISIYDQDGYLVIEEENEGTWLTTAAGLAYLDSIDPEKQFSETLAAHAGMDDVFYDIIAFCAEQPRSIIEIVSHFSSDPRLGPQTYYASYVIDRLEETGALVWKDNWMPTELGQLLLNERPVA